MCFVLQVRLDIGVVQQSSIEIAATFQKEVQVGLEVVQIPPQLRRLEFSRLTPSGTLQLSSLEHLHFSDQ